MKIIVFVHGLGGWGLDEMIFDYWNDIDKYFPPTEYKTFIASVGAISSNWDRACELFAQIKGGKIDYGENHSKKHQHKRFSREYSGFYPEWDSDHKITLIGHSMGGQTIRMLEKFLQVGDSKEDSFLFEGGHDWIENIITISTPHLGSPLFDIVGSYLTDQIKDFIVKLGIKINENPKLKEFYDLDIDHFNLNQLQNETEEEYSKRIKNLDIWKTDYKDISSWNLSKEGAQEFNNLSAPCYPGVKYLAISTYQTIKLPFLNIWLPSPFMLPFLTISSSLMSFYDHNDGLVTLKSSRGINPIKWSIGDTIKISKWHYNDIKLDHMQILGSCKSYLTIKNFIDSK